MDPRAIVVCADYEQAVLWADAAPAELRAHAVTGLTRTAALLKEGRVGVLAGSPPDLAALVTRSALKLDALETIVVAWPEGFGGATRCGRCYHVAHARRASPARGDRPATGGRPRVADPLSQVDRLAFAVCTTV